MFKHILTMLGIILIGQIFAAPAHPQKIDGMESYTRASFSEKFGPRAGRNFELPTRILAIRVQFNDVKFDYSGDGRDGLPHDKAYFERFMFHLGTYWEDASHDLYTMHASVLDSIITLDAPMAYYGDDGDRQARVAQLCKDTVLAADVFVNYSLWDAFFIFHAGAGQEADLHNTHPEDIWSTFVSLSDLREVFDEDNEDYPGIMTDEGAIYGIPVCPETEYHDDFTDNDPNLGMLGVVAHQSGHLLGLPTLFDNYSANGRSAGIGNWGIMGTGAWNSNGHVPPLPCAWSRMYMGWETPVEINSNLTDIPIMCTTLNSQDSALESIPQLYKVLISDSEYFLIENLQQNPDKSAYTDIPTFTFTLLPDGIQDYYDSPNDFAPRFNFMENTYKGCEWNYYTPGYGGPDLDEAVNPLYDGSGLMIWHIDENVIEQSFRRDMEYNSVNATAEHKGVDLEEADGVQHMDTFYPHKYMNGGPFDSFRAMASRLDNNTQDDTLSVYWGGSFQGDFRFPIEFGATELTVVPQVPTDLADLLEISLSNVTPLLSKASMLVDIHLSSMDASMIRDTLAHIPLLYKYRKTDGEFAAGEYIMKLQMLKYDQISNTYFGKKINDDKLSAPYADGYYGDTSTEIYNISPSDSIMSFSVRFDWRVDYSNPIALPYIGANPYPPAILDFDGDGSEDIIYTMPDGLQYGWLDNQFNLDMYMDYSFGRPGFAIAQFFAYDEQNNNLVYPCTSDDGLIINTFDKDLNLQEIMLPGIAYAGPPVVINQNIADVVIAINDTDEGMLIQLRYDGDAYTHIIARMGIIASNIAVLPTNNSVWLLERDIDEYSLKNIFSSEVFLLADLPIINKLYNVSFVPFMLGEETLSYSLVVSADDYVGVYNFLNDEYRLADNFPINLPETLVSMPTFSDVDNNGTVDILVGGENNFYTIDYAGQIRDTNTAFVEPDTIMVASGVINYKILANGSGINKKIFKDSYVSGSFSRNRHGVWNCDTGRIAYDSGQVTSLPTRSRFLPIITSGDDSYNVYTATDNGKIYRQSYQLDMLEEIALEWSAEYANLQRTAAYTALDYQLIDNHKKVYNDQKTFFYPVPFIGQSHGSNLFLNIQLTDKATSVILTDVEIYDIAANLIYKKTVSCYPLLDNKVSINVDKLTSGVYNALIKMQGETIRRKFVIEK